MVRPIAAILVGAALLAAAPAQAQEIANVYLLDGGAFNNALNANTIVSRTRALLGNPEGPASARPARTAPRTASAPGKAMQFTPAPGATAIPAMVAGYPAGRRSELTSVFQQLLGKFGEIERMFGQPRHDLPTALSLYLATSYEAATGIEVTPQQARPLIAQMRGILQGEPGIAGASDAEKQKLYEMLAITGMLNATATLELKRKPDPAVSDRLKTTGRTNLMQLGLDPDRVRFGEQGLSAK